MNPDRHLAKNGHLQTQKSILAKANLMIIELPPENV